LRLPGLVAQVLQTPLPRAEFLLLKGDDLTLLADFIEHRAQFVQPAGLRLGALLKLLDPRLRLRELLEGQVKVGLAALKRLKLADQPARLLVGLSVIAQFGKLLLQRCEFRPRLKRVSLPREHVFNLGEAGFHTSKLVLRFIRLPELLLEFSDVRAKRR